MNEEIVLKMAEPSVKDGCLTYALFDKIYGMLSRKEQYQVCEILYNNNIQLVDAFEPDDGILSQDSSLNAEAASDALNDDSEPLFDESIFKDPKGTEEYLFFSGEIKQSNDALVHLVQMGNRQARQDICIKNENLVRKYANAYYRFFGNDLDFEDLMQAGFLGLLTAADRFDFRKDSAFSTYAVLWIKQAISRQVYDEGYRIRIPVHMMEKIARMSRLDNKYGSDGLDYQQRIEQIAKDMETPIEKVEEMNEIKYQFLGAVSLDTPVGEEEESTLGEFIPTDKEFDVEEQFVQRALSSALEEVLSTLKPREEKILRMRFGFDDGHPKTLEEIGKEFNVTRERIRQIEAKALRKLRHPSRSKKIKDFLKD